MKKAILVLLAISVVLGLIVGIFAMRDSEIGVFWTIVGMIYVFCTTFLCWVGIGTTWNFSRDNDFGPAGTLILLVLGLQFSLLIALYKLLPKSE